MANLPRFGRTWNRFSAAPRPVPAAQPEITPPPPSPPPSSSRLSSPAKKAFSPPPSPKSKLTATRVTYSPIKSARSPPSPALYDGGRRISPKSSPKTTKKTSPPSPTYRQPAAPLSPLNLPRRQSKITQEAEQKSNLYQKIAGAKSDGRTAQKHQADGINVTGHNVGAVMEISQSAGKRGEIVRKKETEGSGYGNDEKGKKDKNQKGKGLPMEAFMNSNFQSVNNSLLYDSSCNHRDPGLHLAFPGSPNDDDAGVDGNREI